MHIWQLQEAKAKLTELVKQAQHEPQIISRHGINEVVVMSIREYRQAFKQEEDIVSFFRNSPLYGADLDLERDKSIDRSIDFGEEDNND